MPWVRLDDHAHRHPKQLQAGPMACWLWVCGLSYCSEHLTDGNIPSAALVTFNIPRPEREAERLVAVGLWEVTETGYRVHDYHEYQPSKGQVTTRRRRTHERVTDWRKRHGYAHGNADGNADVTLLQTPMKRECTHPPVPVPDPVSTDTSLRSVSVGARGGKPLGYKPRIDVAWPGRPPVPSALHAEFITKLGGDHEHARDVLFAWYPTAAAPYEDQPIGDDDFAFWRHRFREWVGTTRQPARTHAAPVPTGYDDWCHHDPQCASREWHAMRLSREENVADAVAR